MGVWTLLVGVRRDLRLRGKWWHHLAVGLAWFSGLISYLIIADAVIKRPYKLTASNTYSMSLLRHAATRPTTTTLGHLDLLGGLVGSPGADGELVLLARSDGSDIRCENQAKYKVDGSVTVAGVAYRSIPDYPDQPPQELRHCVATPSYASLTADSVAAHIPNGVGIRKLRAKSFLSGAAMVVGWEIVYWNVYYRGLIPFYARRRQQRRRRAFERHTVRQPDAKA